MAEDLTVDLSSCLAESAGADLRKEHLQYGELLRQSDNRIRRTAEHSGGKGPPGEAPAAAARAAAAEAAAAVAVSADCFLFGFQFCQQGLNVSV